MRIPILLLLALVLCGCKDNSPDIRWEVRYVPTDMEERQLLANHIERVLSPGPTTLTGDPDYDDVINAVYANAPHVMCEPTLWESEWTGGSWRWTGKWKRIPRPPYEWQFEQSEATGRPPVGTVINQWHFQMDEGEMILLSSTATSFSNQTNQI